jgi:hypothetical protein
MFKRKRDVTFKPKHALQEAIGFTVEDLDINDSGVLSQPQRENLKQDCARWLLFNLAITTLCLFAYNGYQSGPKTYNDIGGLILFYLLLSPFFLVTLNSWVRLFLDIIKRTVGRSEGYIELDVRSNRSGTRFKVRSQSVVFDVDKRVFLAFKNNEPYLIYFAPYSKTIVSAEWLRDSAD